MKKNAILALALGLVMACVHPGHPIAQPVTVQWTQNDVTSAGQAQGFTYRLYVTPVGTTTANPPVTLVSVTCTGTGPTVSCSAPLPSTANAAVVTGAKSTLTSQDTANGTLESGSSLPFVFPSVVPTALRIG